MNQIERYLGRALVGSTFMVLMVLVSLFIFTEFLAQLDDINERYTTLKAFVFSLLRAPSFMYQLFPAALVIGALVGLGALANQNELTVLRVTGWSLRRIFLGLLKSVFLLWLLMVAIGEFVVPQAETYGTKLRAEALNKSLSLGGSSGFWIKEQEQYLQIGQVINDHTLHHVSVYQFKEGQLQRLYKAPEMLYRDGQWWLQGGVEVVLNQANSTQPIPYSVTQQSADNRTIALTLTPEDLSKLDIKSRYLSAWDLYLYLQFLEKNGTQQPIYELEFAKKLASPLVVLAMLAVVFPLIFASQRQVNMGFRIFIGIVLGIGFFLLNELLGNLTIVYGLSVYIGAFVPAILMMVLAWILMRSSR